MRARFTLHRALIVFSLLAASACAPKPTPVSSPAPTPAADSARAPEATSAGDRAAAREIAELERRVALIELQLWERDAIIDELQGRLDDARQEVVRAMAKLQSVATRAEAASALGEADVALQSIRAETPESRQANQLMRQASAEFKKSNYSGALYLANQAKAAISQARGLAGAHRGSLRPGETRFAVPVKLQAGARANVREGPGTSFVVVFVTEPGAALTGISFLGDWLQVTDGAGRAGWIARSLLGRQADPGR